MALRRFKTPESGDEFTIEESAGRAMGLEPLDKDAEDESGRPLPPKSSSDSLRSAQPSNSWKRDDLAQYATDNGVAFDEGATKADILAAIEATTRNSDLER